MLLHLFIVIEIVTMSKLSTRNHHSCFIIYETYCQSSFNQRIGHALTIYLMTNAHCKDPYVLFHLSINYPVSGQIKQDNTITIT